MDSLARVRTMKSTLRVCQIPSAFVQDDEYVLNDDDESEKEDEDKGYAENESLKHCDAGTLTDFF